MKWNAYWRLLRFDKPAGTLLLWYPTAWALWTANSGFPPMKIGLLFLIGTILMRAAGCVINDIADRHIDKHVARTKLRPLTSGEVTLYEAFCLLLILLLSALLILLLLPCHCYPLALVSVLITMIYPFCKRFFNAPQLILGLAFSMGIPMAYRASGMALDASCALLFIINFIWIVAYDTMYAMTDRADDLLIGVKSTAVYFAQYDRIIIAGMQFIMHGLWLYWALSHSVSFAFLGCWLAGGLILIYQQQLINHRIPKECFKAFVISIYYGVLMWIAVGFAVS